MDYVKLLAVAFVALLLSILLDRDVEIHVGGPEQRYANNKIKRILGTRR